MLKLLNRASSGKGFTVIELLIVVLIVGLLAAVGTPLYLSYIRESRLAEGKALLSSVITAAQTCAQFDPANGCALPQIRGKVGLSDTNTTGDGLWAVSQAGGNLTLDTVAMKFGPGGVAFTVAGVAGAVNNVAVTATTDASGRFSLRCNTNGVSAASTDPAC